MSRNHFCTFKKHGFNFTVSYLRLGLRYSVLKHESWSFVILPSISKPPSSDERGEASNNYHTVIHVLRIHGYRILLGLSANFKAEELTRGIRKKVDDIPNKHISHCARIDEESGLAHVERALGDTRATVDEVR